MLACSSHAVREPATTTTATTGAESLPFIHDDYPRAIAEAKKTNRPLFVDAWAPWCHSCMSLKTYVLTDPSLAPLKDKFVWLSIDTERDANAQWVARYQHEALPTLWIIDPATDKPLLKWAGTATAPELKSLLVAAMSNDASTAAFVRGNHAQAEGDSRSAIAEHKKALASATAEQRSRIIEALVTDLSLAKDNAGCAETAAAEAPKMAAGTSRASVIVAGLDCAAEAKQPNESLSKLAIHDATARDESLLPDDRSALYEAAISAKKDSGDERGAQKLAESWVAFLDAEAKRATTKDARTSLDPWRVAAYMAVGDPAKAIPVLDESARDFPNDYNPPARLARVYLTLKRLDDAEKAADRAIALVYGPRAMRVYELRADIARERGDKTAEAKALEDALAKSEHAVLTQGQRSVRDKLAKRLASLRKPD